FGATDYKSANCDGAERESTECNCANGQRSDLIERPRSAHERAARPALFRKVGPISFSQIHFCDVNVPASCVRAAPPFARNMHPTPTACCFSKNLRFAHRRSEPDRV